MAASLDVALDERGARRDALAEAGGEVVEDGRPRGPPPADAAATTLPTYPAPPVTRYLPLIELATSRSRSAAASGGTSLMNTLMPDSEPARNFSLPEVRRMVKSSRWSAKSSRLTPSKSSSAPNGAWCQAAMYGVGGSPGRRRSGRSASRVPDRPVGNSVRAASSRPSRSGTRRLRVEVHLVGPVRGVRHEGHPVLALQDDPLAVGQLALRRRRRRGCAAGRLLVRLRASAASARCAG